LISAAGSSVGERKKKIPFDLDVKHVLGRKSQIKMLESRGVWWEDRRPVA
jgi:hypothetical protein